MQATEPSRRQGLTILEVLAVLAIIVTLSVMVIPRHHRAPGQAKRIACVINLKEVGMAMRLFAEEHGTNFPMNVPASQGGSLELTGDASRLWLQYLRLTNELTSPRNLWCPSDTQRKPATVWATNPADRRAVVFAGNQNLSYFLGLNARQAQPETILAGDRNLTTNGLALDPGRHVFPTNTQFGYTKTMHNLAGNILLADSSVQQVTPTRLNGQFHDALTKSGLTTNVWLVP